jgi:hypothetical protein
VRSSSRRLIDKADPDVPNDLLVPLGSFQFRIPEIDRTITTERQVRQKNSRSKPSRRAERRRTVLSTITDKQQRVREERLQRPD